MEKRKMCSKCKKHNRFASKCKTTDTQTKQIHSVTETDEEYQEILSLDSAGQQNTQGRQLLATMLLGGRPERFQLDRRVSCNIVPIHLLNPDIQLERTQQILVMYEKNTLKPSGKCKIKIRNPRNRRLYRLEFTVINSCTPL